MIQSLTLVPEPDTPISPIFACSHGSALVFCSIAASAFAQLKSAGARCVLLLALLFVVWSSEMRLSAGLSKLAGVEASEEVVNEAVAQMVPIGKVGAKWDIAITVVFLCSSAARHLTGVLCCLTLVGRFKRPRALLQCERTGL